MSLFALYPKIGLALRLGAWQRSDVRSYYTPELWAYGQASIMGGIGITQWVKVGVAYSASWNNKPDWIYLEKHDTLGIIQDAVLTHSEWSDQIGLGIILTDNINWEISLSGRSNWETNSFIADTIEWFWPQHETVQFDEEGRLVRKGAFTRSAFRRKKWGVGLNAAAQYYVGDYQNPRLRPMGEIRVSYRLLPWFNLALDWGLGRLADKEKFQTLMTHMDLTSTFTPFPRKRIRPFGYIGFCTFKFWAEDSEGYDIKREKSTWGGWEPAFIWGAGAEYSITSSWGIHFSVDNYLTLTDELDGVVHGKRDDAFWRGKFGFAYYFNF